MTELSKRPVAFRVPRADYTGVTIGTEWRLFQDEESAREEADALGVEYQGLYVRDGTGFRMPNEERPKTAYDTFRGGLIDPSTIPHWDAAPSWVRDAVIVAYLQGKLDAPQRPSYPARNGGSALCIAKIIWHRFAKDSVEFWEDETHQVEYLDCANHILSEMKPGPPVRG